MSEIHSLHFSMFDPNYRSPEPRLVFRPEKLRELGIPDALIEAAAKSDPLGFLPFDDLPNQIDATGSHADQATTEQSTTEPTTVTRITKPSFETR